MFKYNQEDNDNDHPKVNYNEVLKLTEIESLSHKMNTKEKTSVPSVTMRYVKHQKKKK